MGVITLTLNSPAPYWVIAIAGLAIGLGAYVGGWRYSAVSHCRRCGVGWDVPKNGNRSLAAAGYDHDAYGLCWPRGVGPRWAMPGPSRHLANSSVHLGAVEAGRFEGCRLAPGGRFCLVSGCLVWTGGLWCAGGGLLAWLDEPGQGVELHWCLPLDRDQGGDAAEAAQRCCDEHRVGES
jgi:hypothetical protein